MSTHVKAVTEVATQIADINKQASELAQSLRQNLADVKEALDVTQEVSDTLKTSGAELRATLGLSSNRPPK